MAEPGARLAGEDVRGPSGYPRVGGMALPLVLILLLGLTAFAHGMFLLALQDASASRASRALLQARVLARAGVRGAMADLMGDTLPLSPESLGQGTVPGGSYSVGLERMGREYAWIEGRGAAALSPSGPLRATHRTARLLWALSPLQRVAAFRAVIEDGGGLGPLTVEAVTGEAAGELGGLDAPRGCRDREAQLDSILPSGALPAEARLLPGEGLPPPSLGLLDMDSLVSRIPFRVQGSLTPAPVVEEGVCLEAPGNWGAPSDPVGPCGGYRPAVLALEGLHLVGGEGQGLLVVVGDLTLEAGAHYAGLLLVGGNLTLRGGALLEGLAQAGGRVTLSEGSHLAGRLCPALLALEAATALRRPLAVPGSGWLGPL